jgi:parallel beta-helix repeat protein
VLANNLDIPDANGNCLTITVASVTLNLAGFSISGNGPRTPGAGILAIGSGATPFGGIVVRNGSISNFAVGVDLSFAEGSIVEELRVLNNGLLGIDAHGIVRGNIALDNVGTGIIASGTVTGNYATGNNQSGIAITVPSGSSVIGNTATGNQIGISVNCPANLTDNTAANNVTNLVLNGDGCHNEDNVAP